MSASDWQGDCGDVVTSLWPIAVANELNRVGAVVVNTALAMLGAEQVAEFDPFFTPEDAARMLAGEYPTDPAQYTATARGTA